MKSETTTKNKMGNWVVGVLGLWAGFASIGALVGAMLSPNWAVVKEPITLEETEHVEYAHKVGANNNFDPEDQFDKSLRPVVTSVSFHLGLWIACPNINTSGLHMMIVRPPCTKISYMQSRLSHHELHLPAPAPLAQTVIARMRVSTPFLVAACVLLTIGSLLALVSRCCYNHAAVFAAILFTLGGLSIGVGVLWFISVVSEEFGTPLGEQSSWKDLYGYRYGWSIAAAGGAGVGALVAALLTAHSHVARHITFFTNVCEDALLQRPLIRCRSDGCLGGRSCTSSDTLRTYLTSDSRRYCSRGCSHGQTMDRSPSLVDLTRSSNDGKQDSVPNSSMTHTTSSDDILTTSAHQAVSQRHSNHVSSLQEQPPTQKHINDQSKVQYHYQPHQNKHIMKSNMDKESPQRSPINDDFKLPPPFLDSQKMSIPTNLATPPNYSSSSPSSCSSSTAGPLSLPMNPPQRDMVPQYHTLQHRGPHHNQHIHHTIQHQHNKLQAKDKRPILIRQSSVPARTQGIPVACPPPPSGSVIRQSSSELPRLPELNTFKSDYSKTLPLKEVRQMAVFNRSNGNRSTTLSRPVKKLSSEV